MWIRVALSLALCLHTCQDLAVTGSLGAHVRPAPASHNHASWTTVPAKSGREVRGGDSTNICGGTVLQLRGGGRGHPKATADEYTTVEGIELTDQQVLSPHICSRMRRAPFGTFDCMHDCTHSMRTRTFIMRWRKEQHVLTMQRMQSLSTCGGTGRENQNGWKSSRTEQKSSSKQRPSLMS